MTDGLVLVHGFPLDATMWEPQLTALGSDRVIAPSLPGFGGTPLSSPVMRMDAAADAVAAAADEAGFDRVVLCGISMGGYVSFAFWRKYGDRVAGLVLANTKAEADDEAGKERRQALADRLRTEGSQFLVDSPGPLLSANAPAEQWDRVRAIIEAQPAEAIATASLGMAERADSSRDLARIDVPTLVITSTGDTLIPADVTRTIADRIPGARLEVIMGAGHLSNIEAPDRFTDLLREQLLRSGVGL